MVASVSQDFAGVDPDGDAFSTSGINPSNQVMVELQMLIHYVAEIEGYLRFEKLMVKDFRAFYTIFRELTLKVKHVIDPDVLDEIMTYFEKMPNIVSDTIRFDQGWKGVRLAIKLLDAMVEIGFMRFFDTPNDPPFQMPFFCRSVGAYEDFVAAFEAMVDAELSRDDDVSPDDADAVVTTTRSV
jgi:hypothetical protein